MNILDIFKSKKPAQDKKQEIMNTTVNTIVHEKRNEFQNHLIEIQKEANILGKRINQAKQSDIKLKKLLTITEQVYLSSGGKLDET